MTPPVSLAKPNGQRVIVIGAGISGLAAASKLRSTGFDVVVLEGRDRIGGRIHTARTADGIAMDLGASWIHGTTDNPIYELAQKYDVNLFRTDFDSVAEYDSDGDPLDSEKRETRQELFDAVMEAVAELQENAEDHDSLQSGIQSVVAELKLTPAQLADLAFMVHSEIEHDYGGDSSDLSLGEWDQDSGFDGPDRLFPEGYDQITKRLAEGLDIRTAAIVSAINYSSHPISVQTSAGEFTADKVVITLPLGVLKSGKVKFSPALPDEKKQAIKRLRMGVLNKLYLRFPDAFWPRKKQRLAYQSSPLGPWSQWYSLLPCNGEPILVGFNAASTAVKVEALSDADTVASGMAVLRKIFGKDIPDPVEYRITRWSSDPFSLGSYSHTPPGASGEDYEMLAEPVEGKLYFAGEATSQKYPQSVHGAYLTGIRAARSVGGNR